MEKGVFTKAAKLIEARLIQGENTKRNNCCHAISDIIYKKESNHDVAYIKYSDFNIFLMEVLLPDYYDDPYNPIYWYGEHFLARQLGLLLCEEILKDGGL